MPGLGTLADAPAVARIIHAATGEDAEDMRIAGRGETSVGWRVDARGGPYCVVVEIPADGRRERYQQEPTNYAARHAVLTALAELDEPSAYVARPVATRATLDGPDPVDGRWDWIVTSWTDGAPATDGISDAAAAELGRFLAQLHRVPAEGYGLLQNIPDAIRGSDSHHREGLLSRWAQEFWPFDGRPLIEHPIVRVAPQLVTTIATLRELLLRFDQQRTEFALTHSDLYAGHVYVDGDRFTGLIDFGDAAVLPPAVDIASFAYYFGWSATDALLEGYTSNSVFREIRLAEAHHLAVAIALQKIEKHVVRVPDEERLQYAVSFLEETIPIATRRHA